MTMTILAVTKCIILKHPSVITGKNFLRNMYMQNMSSISRDIQKISFKILRKSIVPKNVLKNWVAWNKAAINKPHIQPYIFSGRGKPLILEEREKGVAFFPPFASSSIYGFVFFIFHTVHYAFILLARRKVLHNLSMSSGASCNLPTYTTYILLSPEYRRILTLENMW